MRNKTSIYLYMFTKCIQFTIHEHQTLLLHVHIYRWSGVCGCVRMRDKSANAPINQSNAHNLA